MSMHFCYAALIFRNGLDLSNSRNIKQMIKDRLIKPNLKKQ